MFSDTTEAVAFGKQFVFQQRALEIASRGCSNTQIPKKGLKKPPSTKLDPVVNKILCAIEEQEEILHRMTGRIFRTSRLATKLLNSNPKMAASTMRKVKSIQQQFVHILRVKAGMEAYKKHVKCGLQDLKNVDKNLACLRNARWNNNACTAPDESLLAQLKLQKFYPIADSTGRISLSENPSFTLGSEAGSATFSIISTTSTIPVPLSP